MSQINIFSELTFKADTARMAIRAVEAEIRGMAQRVNAMRVQIPVTIDDHVSRAIRQIALNVAEMKPAMQVRIDTGSVQESLRQVQAQVAATPIVIPAVVAAGGAAGGAAGASAAEAVTSAESGQGFLAGAFTRRGAFAGLMAVHALNRLAEEVDQSITARRSLTGIDPLARIEDPDEQLKMMRQAIDREHTGLRGWANAAYGALGLQPTFTSETATLDEGQRSSAQADRRDARVKQQVAARNQFRQMMESLNDEADTAGGDDLTKRQESIDKAFRKAQETLDKVDEAWQLYGKNYADVQAMVARARATADQIHSAGTSAVEAARKAREDTLAGRVGDIRERGIEAGLRAGGEDALANYRAREAAINRPIRELQIRMTQEESSGQSSKARDTAKELEAMQDAADKEHMENLMLYQKALRAERRKIQGILDDAEETELTTAGKPGEARIHSIRADIERELESAEGNPAMQAAIARRGIARLEAERKNLQGEPRLQGVETLGNQLLTAGFRSDHLDDIGKLKEQIDDLERKLTLTQTVSNLDAGLRSVGLTGLGETIGLTGGDSPFGTAPEKLDAAGSKLSAAGDKMNDAFRNVTHIAVLDTVA
jgi:hypothetical protein